MLFNGKKFEMLRYGKNEELKNSTMYLTPGAEDFIEARNILGTWGSRWLTMPSSLFLSVMFVPKCAKNVVGNINIFPGKLLEEKNLHETNSELLFETTCS